MLRVTRTSIGLSLFLSCSVLAIPLKFPDQHNAPAYSEGRFLNIHGAPNGLFNRLTATNTIQDEVNDYDDSVVGVQQSAITSPRPSAADIEDRRRHRNRKRPCVPYTPFRSNNNVGRQADQGQGRTFFSLLWNDYNFYGSPQGSPQYDTYGGYPCYSLGGQQTHRPQRPHRPHLEGTSPDGISNDTPGGSGNLPGGFFGVVQSFLNQWLRPQSGTGGLSDSTNNDVKPVIELNVQDTVQDVVSTTGGFFGAIQGLFSQTPPLSDPAPPVENQQDDLIQPRPSSRPHKHHFDHLRSSSVNGVTQIAGGITNTVSGFANPSASVGPQTFIPNRRRSNNFNNNAPFWSFFGLFN